MGEQRKLAAIMFTDIVGYSAMMSKDDNHAMNYFIIFTNQNLNKSKSESYEKFCN